MSKRYRILKSEKQVKIVPGEMQDMDVNMISLVKKGANGQKIQIYKSDEEPDPDEDAQGLLDLVKSFFSGRVNKADEAVKPATKAASKKTFASMMAVNDITENMWRANDTLRSVMRDIINNEEITDKKAALLQAVEEYSAYMKDKVNVSTIAKSAAFFDVPETAIIEKSGKKVSTKNLTALKDAHKALTAVIEEAEDSGKKKEEDEPAEEGAETGEKNPPGVKPGEEQQPGGNENPKKEKEDEKVKKEDLAGVMKEAMEDVLKPINERLDRIEKSETGGEPAEDVADGDIASIVKAAVSEIVNPINERLDKIEKSRALPRSHEGEETQQVNKQAGGDAFAGFFVED